MASTISAGTSAGTAIAIAGDTSGALALQTNNGTTAVTVDTSQNVGIGTTSPTNKLTIDSGATGTAASFKSSSVYSEISFKSGSSTTAYIGVNNADILFEAGNAERMRITSGGTVLIGKTSSAFATSGIELFPTGELDSTASAQATLFLNRTTSDGSIINFYRQGSSVGSISVTGSATAYNTSSDYRLKENIAPMTGALDKVAQLKPVTYKWKIDGSAGQGFIAHELQAVVPDCVSGEKDAVDKNGNPEYQGIDTSFLVATLTAAIQELNAKVDAQATTIAELQAKVS
jgi:hypothetical protein